MNFTTAIKVCLVSKYICFEGRASRSEYWYFQLFLFLISLIVQLVLVIISSEEAADTAALILQLAVLLPRLGVEVRRLHDTDHSGWWYLLIFTGIGIFVIFYWDLLAGDDGDNRFGEDPLLEEDY